MIQQFGWNRVRQDLARRRLARLWLSAWTTPLDSVQLLRLALASFLLVAE